MTDLRLLRDTCGFQQAVGCTLTEWRADLARIEQAVSPAILNRQGIPHGGLHATPKDLVTGCNGDDRPDCPILRDLA